MLSSLKRNGKEKSTNEIGKYKKNSYFFYIVPIILTLILQHIQDT